MTTWISLHAFHHGDLDELLLHGVRPLVTRLRQEELIDGFFFLRYWDGGPHLRIRLSPVTAAAAPDVRGIALGRLRDHLTAHPSRDLPDLGGYAASAARLAAGEGMTDYLRAPLPNNTVHEIPYRPETDRYGEGASLAAAERHFTESSRIALGLIGAGSTPDQRCGAALSALLLAWHGRRVPPPAGRADDEQRYIRVRAGLRGLAERAARIGEGTAPPGENGALTAWWRTVGTLPDPGVRDLCAHLFCNRLGIPPGRERSLRYLAARALTSETEHR